ncbi:MAG: XRE family transcriptional regulator [Fusobacteriaceae bacterium]|jgi:repressor LexA|nr:XRE family transcriptional regulator [Fusobacteriaceae bacterium]
MALLHENIKYIRLKRGYTLAYMADNIGITEATMQRIESGYIKNVKYEYIVEIARICNVTPQFLFGWELEEKSLKKVDIEKFDPSDILLLDNLNNNEFIIGEENADYLNNENNDNKAEYAFKAKDNSMIGARIEKGDIVFIKKQDSLNNGDIALLIIENEITLKRIFYEKDKIILTSENPNYNPIIFEKNQSINLKIIGKIISVLHKF